MSLKVVIVDDHPLVRQGLKFVFSFEEDIELLGEAKSLRQAKQLLINQKPDIILIDLKLGNEDGLDLIKYFSGGKQLYKFIILTSSVELVDFMRALQVGVDGYIIKEAVTEEILYAIRLVHKGRKYYDPLMLEYKIQNEKSTMIDELTQREREVLLALGNGCSNKQISSQLFITENTVKKHVSQILSKLELKDRTQVALYVNRIGLVRCLYDSGA